MTAAVGSGPAHLRAFGDGKETSTDDVGSEHGEKPALYVIRAETDGRNASFVIGALAPVECKTTALKA